MGSTVAMSVRPVRDVSTCVLVGDEQFNNDNVEGEGLEKLSAAARGNADGSVCLF